MEESTKYSVEVLKAFIAENGRWPSADLRKEHSSKFERGLYVWANAQIKKGNQEVINLKKATPTKRSLSRWGMTLEEKVGQLVQCNAGQFIANDLGITGPGGQLLPAADLARVMGSVLTFENAAQAKALQDLHLHRMFLSLLSS